MIFPEPKSVPFRSDRKNFRSPISTLKAPITNQEPFMNAYFLLFAQSLLSVALSFAVLFVLSGPLVNVLGRICPDEQAAVFWLSYTKVMLMIAPLLLVLMVNMFSHFSDPMDSLRLALIAALGGLLIGLHSIGRRLGQFVATPQKPGGAA